MQQHQYRDSFALLGLLGLFFLPLATCSASLAQQDGVAGIPGYYPTVSPGIQPSVPQFRPDYVPKFSADFWRGASLGSYLEGGTVLTGVLQDRLSSKSSKVGDLFSITLPDGYCESGRQLLPAGCKIVGAVSQVVSGKESHNSEPGRVAISLQTLVLPDGRTTPIFAFIERNPNTEFKKNPYKPKSGLPLASYGQSIKNSLATLTNSVSGRATGMPLYFPGRTGSEFLLEPGQTLPLRLNRPIDLGALMRQPIPAGMSETRGNVPGLVDEAPSVAPAFQGPAQNRETYPPDADFGLPGSSSPLNVPDRPGNIPDPF